MSRNNKKTKFASFGPAKMERIAFKLPQSAAASIGRTIARHAYLDFVKGNTLHSLLGISVKQGRVAIRLPDARRYVSILGDLLLFLRIQTDINWTSYYDKLVAADSARNSLAHSLFLEEAETKKIKIQLVRGNWDGLPPDVKRHNRALNPQVETLDRAFLVKQRNAVEVAIKQALKIDALVYYWLLSLNEKRATQPLWDRRNRRQS